MGLLGNRSRSNFGAIGSWGIAPALTNGNVHSGGERYNWIRKHYATTVLALTAKHNGYYSPATYHMAITAGEISTRAFGVTGYGTVSAANLAGGLNGVSPVTGSGDITNAGGTMVINGTAPLTGSGNLTASILGKLEAVAALTGSGDVSGTLNAVVQIVASLTGSATLSGNIVGILNAVASLTGSGDITSANLSGAIQAVAALTGSAVLAADVVGSWKMLADLVGSASATAAINAIAYATSALTGISTTNFDVGAKGGIQAAIVVTGDLLTTANVGSAVWEELLSSHITVGTAGETLTTIVNTLTATIAELSQGQPPKNPTPLQALMLLYMAMRNGDNTTNILKVIKDDSGTVIAKSVLSDDGTTFNRAKLVTGP